MGKSVLWIIKGELITGGIVIGRKTNVPFSTGCYFEDGSWVLYGVDERQNFSIVEKGDEDRIFKLLYMITMGKIGK